MATENSSKKVTISSEEIEKHNNRDDLWMVINGKVYDVTPFVDEHPGGEEVLVDCGGQDATTAFEVSWNILSLSIVQRLQLTSLRVYVYI